MKTVISILLFFNFCNKQIVKSPVQATINKCFETPPQDFYDQVCSDYLFDIFRYDTPPLEHLYFLDSMIVKYDLPRKIIYRQVYYESGFNCDAVSHRGARGYMQIMPKTFAEIQDKIKIANDAYGNIQAGCYYMRFLMDRYDNDVMLALAAYNSGPYNEFTRKGLIPPYTETQTYIRKILCM